MTETHARPETQAEFRNSWLEGPFAPVDQEVTVYDLKVTGSIPKDLDGRLLRVGPNPVDPENPVTYNWFTGNGMVHGVRIRDGKAEWYRNRFVRDDHVARSKGLPPLPGPQQLGGGARYVADNVVNTHIFPQAGKTWAFAEAGVLPVELSYELECLAKSDFGGSLNGSWTGHPHRDPATGELHGMSYYHGWEHVSYQVIDTTGQVRRTVDVPVHGRPVVHDCALTERYAVFLDGPVAYSDDMLKKGYAFPFLWGFEYPTRWVLIPRDGVPGDVDLGRGRAVGGVPHPRRLRPAGRPGRADRPEQLPDVRHRPHRPRRGARQPEPVPDRSGHREDRGQDPRRAAAGDAAAR